MSRVPPCRVGVIGTSWWADAMYLPALSGHRLCRVVAVAGRDPDRTDAFARRWGVELATTDPSHLLDTVDAVVIATPNDSHAPLARAAIDAGVHVCLEKPVALDAATAHDLARRARAAGLITLVPFTYRWMPHNRFVHRLVHEGAVGRVHHAQLRYLAGYGLGPDYRWRFDAGVAGSGVIGDLGSHWLHLVRWWLGECEAVAAHAGHHVRRAPRPDGRPHEAAEDAAALTLRFPGGAWASLIVSAVAHEGGPFGQSHHAEIHGSAGTIRAVCDWDTVQEVRYAAVDDPAGPRPLPIPDESWAGARRDRVVDTYHDVFRAGDTMARAWIDAVVEGRSIEPDLAEGARVQTLVDAALASIARHGRFVEVPPDVEVPADAGASPVGVPPDAADANLA